HPRKNDANRAPSSWRTQPNGDHNHEVHAEMPLYLATYRKAAIRVLDNKNRYCEKHRTKTARRETVGEAAPLPYLRALAPPAQSQRCLRMDWGPWYREMF